jgi:hypothetical protein
LALQQQVIVYTEKAWHDTVPVNKSFLFGPVVFVAFTTLQAQTTEDVPRPTSPPPEVREFLKEQVKEYGPDAVSLLTWLMEATTHSGSILTASAKINGYETQHDRKFLVFRIDTGLIFNSRLSNQTARLATLWTKILAYAFAQVDPLNLPAEGVVIDFFYHQKVLAEAEDLSEHVDDPGRVEEAKFYFLEGPLLAFLSKQLPAQSLLDQSQVILDGVPVRLILPGEAITTTTHASAADIP